ncbi:MAG: hypothetical protein V1853_00185 [bacterium]
MTKQSLFKFIIYGILQWVLLMFIIFVISLIYGVKEGAEMTVPPALGLAGVAVILGIIAYAFGRQLKPSSRKQVIIAGLVWSGITTMFMSVTALGNDTQGVVFGNWGMYLLFVAQIIGTMFVRVKK